MKKFFSLLRAVMSQDMSLFRFKAKQNSSNLTKIITPIALGLLVMYAVGTMYLPITMELEKVDMTYIVLSIAILFPSLLAFMEGIYKSQSLLFEPKDSDLLFSLPISKKKIILVRLIKLFTFQFLYNLLFVIPGIVLYVYYERPSAYFYVITILMLLLIPIIPTVLGCFFGYIIKRISVNMKNQKGKKMVQTVITMIFIIAIMAISFSGESITKSFTQNATEINNTIETYYYPVKAYNELIKGFNIITLLKLLLVNIIPVALFVLIVTRKYFSIVSKSKDNPAATQRKIVNVEELEYKQRSQFRALLKKEFNRYFSSTIYMINTLFGLVLLLIATVSLSLNFEGAFSYIGQGEVSAEDINTLYMLAPKVFLSILIAMSFMTSITSSSISLEGKSINILKSLPVKTDKILFAKIMMSNIITIPAILICDIIFCLKFNVSFLDALLILITSFIAPSIAATFGLIINLKYPKMNATSDTEVVKQSMSSMVAVLGGMFMAGIFVAVTFLLAGFGDFAMIGEIVLLAIILLILWIILTKYGKKRFKEIEV